MRPDGRSLQKFRPASVNVGSIKTADGSAIVKIGNTVVVCGIKAVSGVQQGLVLRRGYVLEYLVVNRIVVK